MTSESQLQQILVQVIKSCFPDILISLSMSGLQMHGSVAQKAKVMDTLRKEGFRRGLPDLTIYLPDSISLQLELKVGSNKQSKDQIEVESILRSLGHNYYLIYSIKDAMTAIAQNTTLEYRQSMYDKFGSKLPINTKQYYNL